MSYTTDIIIPVWNNPEVTRRCVESVLANSSDARLIIVDNDSDETTAAMLRGYERGHDNITLITNGQNLGFIKAVNNGMRASAAPYLCVLNNDTQVGKGWLSELIKVAESSEDIGLVNPGLEKYAAFMGATGYLELDYCRGFCMLIKRRVVEKAGLLEESYGFGYFDDKDYSSRALRSGFRCVMAGRSRVTHIKDNSFKQKFAERVRGVLFEHNKRLYWKRWGRPMRILFVLKRTDTIMSDLYPVLRSQHKVNIITSLRCPTYNHSEIQCLGVPDLLVIPSALVHLLHNSTVKKEKRYDVVICDDDAVYAALKRVNGFKPHLTVTKEDALNNIEAAKGETLPEPVTAGAYGA